tara:strand:- start:2664 stop:4754 length:2091 start_codon:yes stop_codon:yes gene_type:complete
MAGDTIKFLIEMRDGASAPLKKVGKAADQSGKSAQGASTKYTELSSKLHLMGLAAKAAIGAVNGVLKPMRALARGGIEAGAQMEGFETRLNVLMGSSEAAKDRLDELFRIGSTTPFELPGLIEAEVNLRALGVNAEETLPLVMDFAGAMGTDLASAAVEVGRAMQFGAGAVETISGRALRAQVELRTGADALKMSTEEFREAMVTTLTDPDGIFKGGTDKLAATFDGMLSNLQDSFFKFKKDIGDAGLFDTAKETLRAMLEFIDQNSDGLRVMSRVISDGVVRGLLGSVKLAGFLFDAFLAVGAAIMDIASKWTTMVVSIGDVLGAVGLGPSKEEQQALESRLSTLADTKEELIAMGGFATQAEDMVSKIQTRVANLPKGRAGGRGVSPTPQAPQQQDGKPADSKAAEEAAAALDGLLVAQESMVELEKELLKAQRNMPFSITEGLAKAISSPFGTMTKMMGPAGGMISALSELGKAGSKTIIKGLKDSIKGVIKALVQVIPDLIVELPRLLIDMIPVVLEGLFKAIPALVEALIIKLPIAIVKSLFQWWKSIWQTVRDFLFPRREERKARRSEFKQNLQESGVSKFGQTMAALFTSAEGKEQFNQRFKKHAGTSHVDRTGMFLLQAGEQVVPSSGTTTQGMARRMGGGGGMNVTINTNVVDQNSIRGLGKLLEQEFSSFGRSTSPLFNSPTGSRG